MWSTVELIILIPLAGRIGLRSMQEQAWDGWDGWDGNGGGMEPSGMKGCSRYTIYYVVLLQYVSSTRYSVPTFTFTVHTVVYYCSYEHDYPTVLYS